MDRPRSAQPPAIVAVHEDAEALDAVERHLVRRYGSDYRIVIERSGAAGVRRLEALRAEGARVAVVLAAQWMVELTGSELLGRVPALHAEAKRGLLVRWGAWADPETARAIHDAMALGRMDYYVLEPGAGDPEAFHRIVTDFLFEWSRTDPGVPQDVALIAPRWSPRGHELRALLARNGLPHVFHPSDSPAGRELLERAGRPDASVPVVVLRDGRVLVDPSNGEVAAAYGVHTEVGEGEAFDVVVVGAGPAGLAASVYGAAEGLRTLAVEEEAIGGQAGSSSLIRNYLGFPRGVSGAQLAQRAYQQAWAFGTRVVFMRRVEAIEPAEDGAHRVRLDDGSEVVAKAVVLATGVAWRRLGVPALEERLGAGVFYGASTAEAQALAGQDALVVGGGNSAGQAALHLARHAREVEILVRGDSLAHSMSHYLRDAIDAARNVHVRLHTEVVDGAGAGRLESVTLRDTETGELRERSAAGLFVLIGARPRTDWLPAAIACDEWGYVLTGPDLSPETWPLERAPSMLETSLPGVFAVGDLRHGSTKRVASAVGEGSVVIQQVYRHLAREPEGAAWR